MAELEVAKHTKAVYKAWNNPNTSWKHKLKEILQEILIIVFAVSISIWFHNWSEKNHDHEEAKEFLQGLKIDLQHDVQEMNNDKNSYIKVLNGAAYFTKVAKGFPLQQDSLQKYEVIFFNTTLLNPNSSRFEGLKASGRLNIIENKNLLNDILDLYQENIPFLNMLNQGYNSYKTERLGEYLDKNLVYDNKGNANWETVLHKPEIQNAFLRRAASVEEIIVQYQKTIDKANEIIKEVGKELQ